MVTKHFYLKFAEDENDWVQSCSPQARAIWAKTGEEGAWLNLPQHLLDAACVAAYLWEKWVSPSIKKKLSELLSLSEDDCRALYIFLSGVHDVGKATITFVRQIEDRVDYQHLFTAMSKHGLRLENSAETLFISIHDRLPHSVASGRIVSQWLQERGVTKRLANSLSYVVDAHHGMTPNSGLRKDAESIFSSYPEEWAVIHHELIEGMADISGIGPLLETFSSPRIRLMADSEELLTGLVVMADWIASNQDYFPLHGEITQLERLSRAVECIDLTEPWNLQKLPNEVDQLFRQSFGWPTTMCPRPVQIAAVNMARRSGSPFLMLIEAATGEGKTEAGLAAASIAGVQQGSQGIFFAAPTMSTANGLFQRTVDWTRYSTVSNSVTSLYLAHSRNKLSSLYRSLRHGYTSIGIDEAEGGSVIASQWMSGNKKGILSNIVVGTIDQVLALSLQMRHSMLRHIGLAGKIIIIDEVHSYDAYMSSYLATTVQWLARYGTSIIMMSATLPPEQKKALVEAYAEEGCREPLRSDEYRMLDNEAYPLITLVNEEGVHIQEVPSRRTDMEAQLTLIDDALETVADLLEDALSDGGIALVICNTIRRAQDLFRKLTSAFPEEVELHHSAFTATARSAKEDRLRDILGPHQHRGTGRPDRLVIVSTQVAEQSLDIDADVLITDIAPMDLLIQRAGRLFRHQRPMSDRPLKLQSPTIYIRGIKEEKPVPLFDTGTEAVYDKKLLMTTYLHIPQVFHRPDDISPLVRSVYKEEQDMPEEWQEAWEKSRASSDAQRDRAESRASTFRIPRPRESSHLPSLFGQLISPNNARHSEEEGYAQVRDAEPAIEAIAIQQDRNGGYGPMDEPWIEEIFDTSELSFRQALQLAGVTLRLPAWMTRRDADFEEVITDLENMTPTSWAQQPLLKGKVALRFNEERTARVGQFDVIYSSDLGLEVERVMK